MRAAWLVVALAAGCHASLPDPVEPLARPPDAEFRRRAPERLPGVPPARLPEVRTERLGNGLLVVVATRPQSPTTTVELVVRGDSSNEPSSGSLALATAFALVEGPETMFTADVDHEAPHLGIETDESGLDVAVKEIANVVLRPSIDATVVDSTRGFMSRRLARAEQSDRNLSVVYKRLYATPPALLGAQGANAFEINQKALLDQHQRFYGPENAALIVAGPAPFEHTLKVVVEHFGGWKAGARPAPKSPSGLPLLVPSLGPRPVIAFDSIGDMARAIVVFPGPPKGFPGFPEYLLADVLLANSIGSRGYAALRLHDAKSYGVWSTLERRRTETELSIYFSVEQDDFVESLQKILSEIERLRREPVSAEELEVAKIAWQARLSSKLVTSSGTVALLREGFALYGDPTALGSIVESVERVHPEELLEVARREFTPDRMQVVVFASRKKLEAALRHVGPIWWQGDE